MFPFVEENSLGPFVATMWLVHLGAGSASWPVETELVLAQKAYSSGGTVEALPSSIRPVLGPPRLAAVALHNPLCWGSMASRCNPPSPFALSGLRALTSFVPPSLCWRSRGLQVPGQYVCVRHILPVATRCGPFLETCQLPAVC